MNHYPIPKIFHQLQATGCLADTDIINSRDGFYMAYQSLSDLLAQKSILDFLDSEGRRLACSSFFDDWFLYAVPDRQDYVYSLLKLREQEHDMGGGVPSDGDTPGVTISFVAFACQILLDCLADSSDENRQKLNSEINRVVARRRQNHHEALKRYFANPETEGAYLVAIVYTKHIASFAVDGLLPVPDRYRELAGKLASGRCSGKDARVPKFIASLNEKAGRVVCDSEQIYIRDHNNPDQYEAAAILATHAGNTSLYSFAAEVEYHARFLTPLVKVRVPFLGWSPYDSAIRADMTIGDTEIEGPAPFYKPESKIVKRQHELHRNKEYEL